MISIVTLFLLLLLPFVQARAYVQFAIGKSSVNWSRGYGGISASTAGSEQACQSKADNRVGGVGYLFQTSGNGNRACLTFTSYPTLCSGYTMTGTLVQGMVDRCSSRTGYKMAADGSCIYTGGVGLTDATYKIACPQTSQPDQSIPSPAYRRRGVEEQSSFVGGKTCPVGEQACPLGKGFGCVDIKNNLSSCGGCTGGAGVDCSEIIGASENTADD
ncbi:hypothetical protein BDY24DRAFT_418214 [Mrakia frigida]|uniref:uncharacterized protein n=1 Tax=Mrakia frigida TaxID=29902 RepID=UPI003FCC1F47